MDSRFRAPSEVLPDELRATRKRKEWTQQQLADRLAELGAPIDRSALAKIEGAARGVSIDEVFWLAAALDVSPLALLLPRADEQVAVAPAVAVSTWEAMQWARGVHPLGVVDPAEAASHRFFYEARPDYEAESIRRHPGVRDLWMLTELAMFYAGTGEMRPSLERVLQYLSDDAAQELAKLQREGLDDGSR